MTRKRMSKLHVSTLKENMSEKASLEFRLRKIDDTQNYLEMKRA